MKRIRFRAATLACWLILFYNIERLLDPINITTMAYTMVFLVAVLTLIAPRLSRAPLWAILAASLLIFVALKAWTGSGGGGTALPLAVTEVCAIVLTIILARWVSSAVCEFEDAVAHITLGQPDQVPEPAAAGRGYLYREVRRARNYQRPLTLMAVAVKEESIKFALDRLAQEAQWVMLKQYALSGVSRVLCSELEDCHVVVQNQDHFLIVLPEVTPEQLPGLMERLRKLVSEQVGVTLRFGTASLPQDGLTFEGLVAKAVKDVKDELERRPAPQTSAAVGETPYPSSLALME